jgi:hypothetical protein
VSVCFLDEEVDTMCWLPENFEDCGPSMIMVDCVSPSLRKSGV